MHSQKKDGSAAATRNIWYCLANFFLRGTVVHVSLVRLLLWLYVGTLPFSALTMNRILNAANEPESSVTMVVVLAAPGALLIAIIGLAAILAVYHRQRRRNLRQQPSQSAAQTCDGDDANDDVSNYTKTANGKPDVIKSKRGTVCLLFLSMELHTALYLSSASIVRRRTSKNKCAENNTSSNICHLCFGYRNRPGMPAR
jgi:hypothetical protein